jgi:hypothetical protein
MNVCDPIEIDVYASELMSYILENRQEFENFASV